MLRDEVVARQLDEVQHRQIEKANDVPDGKGNTTWRWTRPPMPTRLTLVNGVPTFENGAYTGNKPGKFLSPAANENAAVAIAAE